MSGIFRLKITLESNVARDPKIPQGCFLHDTAFIETAQGGINLLTSNLLVNFYSDLNIISWQNFFPGTVPGKDPIKTQKYPKVYVFQE